MDDLRFSFFALNALGLTLSDPLSQRREDTEPDRKHKRVECGPHENQLGARHAQAKATFNDAHQIMSGTAKTITNKANFPRKLPVQTMFAIPSRRF